jgi:protein-L-isoaspartate(D-aspartate) O-methyltransferase
VHEPGPDPFLARRLALVRELEIAGIRDPDVLAAFAGVPRERFVPPDLVQHAYDDSALGIGRGQTISQPYMVARMTELLELTRPGLLGPMARRALDVGTGSGYQAAILAALGADVISIERDPGLSASAEARLREVAPGHVVRCVHGDGSEGWPDGAPYDGIVVAAATPQVPEPLLAQLADAGHLVVPIGPRDHQWLHVFTKHGGRIEERVSEPCVFVPLVGRFGFPP